MTSDSIERPIKPSVQLGPGLQATLVFFVLGFPVGQLVIAGILAFDGGTAPPFTTLSEWTPFLGTMAGVGAVAGLCWYASESMPPGFLKYTLRNSISVCALAGSFEAAAFRVEPLAKWLRVLMFTALVVGAIFGLVQTVLARLVQRWTRSAAA